MCIRECQYQYVFAIQPLLSYWQLSHNFEIVCSIEMVENVINRIFHHIQYILFILLQMKR